MTDYRACVLCTSKPREAEVGLLCASHYSRLASTLRDIEDEAVMLDARPSMAQRPGSGGGGLASEHVAVRLDVLAFRDPRTKRWEPDTEPRYIAPDAKAVGPWCLLCDHESCTAWRAGRRRDLHDDEHDAGSGALASVLDEVHNWARLVREERSLSQPERVTLTGERDLLSRQLPWIAEQPWVDEMFGDMRKLLGQLRTINRTRPEQPVGTCNQPADDGLCGGHIWRREQQQHAWRALADRCTRDVIEVADGPAYCDRCGQSWDDADLERLELILEMERQEKARPRTVDGRPMMTAVELAAEHGVKLSTMRTWLSRAKASAVNGYYDPEAIGSRTRSAA